MWDVLKIVSEYAGILIWSTVKGVLLWLLLGCLLSAVLYVVVTRLKLLYINGEQKRWPRIVFLLVLVLVFLPLIGLAGGITGARDASKEIVLDQVKEHGLAAPLGQVLCLPIALAHLTTETGQVDLPQLYERLNDDSDMSFMLDGELKKRAFSRLTEELFTYSLENQKIVDELRESEVGEWLLNEAVGTVVPTSVEDDLEEYTELFANLEADSDGGLTFGRMNNLVGTAFFEKNILIYFEQVFNAFRLKVLIGALLAVVLTVLLVRLYSWMLSRRHPVDQPVGQSEV